MKGMAAALIFVFHPTRRATSQVFSITRDHARSRRSDVLYSVFMLKEILEQGQRTTDASLEKLLPAATQRPDSIHQAMRHSVFAGGKRLRPVLCMEAARMIAGRCGRVGQRSGNAAHIFADS